MVAMACRANCIEPAKVRFRIGRRAERLEAEAVPTRAAKAGARGLQRFAGAMRRLLLLLPLPLPLPLPLILTLTFGAPPERRSRRTRPRRGAAHGCAAFSAEAGCLL